jgi:hypothetical protein
MKIKTNEATGVVLDWLVAKCEGWSDEGLEDIAYGYTFPDHAFSTDWAQGGPIIEREGFNIQCVGGKGGTWVVGYAGCIGHIGPSPLIAAMRCYVARNLGSEVEVPEELNGQ